MRIEAEAGKGEFGHVGAADDDETCRLQPGNRRRILFRRGGIGMSRGAGRSRLTLEVEQILHRDRDAGIGRRCGARSAQSVMGGGSGQRLLGMHRDEGALALPLRIADAIQRPAHHLHRIFAPAFQRLGPRLQCLQHCLTLRHLRPAWDNRFAGSGNLFCRLGTV